MEEPALSASTSFEVVSHELLFGYLGPDSRPYASSNQLRAVVFCVLVAAPSVFAELQHAPPTCVLNFMETTPLDPSLPGVRMLQTWIREGLAVSIAVLDQERIEGRLIWQHPEFLALERLGSTRHVLIARRHITLIRSID